MFKMFMTGLAALSMAATPAAAAASSASALAIQPAAETDGATGNPFTAPGAAIGFGLFSLIVVLGILTATGTIFDDDDPVSA